MTREEKKTEARIEEFRATSHAACVSALRRFEQGKDYGEQLHGVLDMYHAATIYGRLARTLLDGADQAQRHMLKAGDPLGLDSADLRAMFGKAKSDAEEQLLGVTT